MTMPAAQVPFLVPLLLLFVVVIDPASAFYTCKHGMHKYIWIGHSTGSSMNDQPTTPKDKGTSQKAKAVWAEEIKYWKSKGAAGKAAFERQMRLARIIDKNPAGIDDATDWYYWPSARCESVQVCFFVEQSIFAFSCSLTHLPHIHAFAASRGCILRS